LRQISNASNAVSPQGTAFATTIRGQKFGDPGHNTIFHKQFFLEKLVDADDDDDNAGDDVQLHRSGVFALRGANNPQSPGYTSYRTSKRFALRCYLSQIQLVLYCCGREEQLSYSNGRIITSRG